MKLTPRYDGEPIIDLAPREMTDLVATQRRRFAQTLATLDEAQWAAPSRCAEWSAQGVVSHLVEVNQFWTYSIRSALAGTPSTLLMNFDPVVNPARSVARMGELSPAEVLARFVETNADLASAMADVTDWAVLAESPPGHVCASTAMHHALWDSWTHERDVLVPLGITPVLDDGELAACLRYAATLAPAFALMLDPDRSGAFGLATTDPAVRIDVVVDNVVSVREGERAPTLTGSTLDVLEMLSIRAPLTVQVPAGERWMFTGLATVFDEPR